MLDSFIEFYGKHSISPVRQEISDLSVHYERRNNLFRHLGILPSCITGKRILEIGPGSGFNSIHIASLKPFVYHLIEGNPKGAEQTQELFNAFFDNTDNIHIYETLIENFNTDTKYDLVICEGMLSGANFPQSILDKISSFVDNGGILAITATDPVSVISESLRLLLGQIIIGNETDLDKIITKLLPLFSSHLDSLSGMSRRYDDWVIDNIINPAAIGSYLSIPEAVDVVGRNFTFYSSSPRIFTDWRWYKSIKKYGEINDSIVVQYWSKLHNFIDHTKIFEDRVIEDNKKLFSICKGLRLSIKDYYTQKHNNPTLAKTITLIEQLTEHTSLFSKEIAESFYEVSELLKAGDVNAQIWSTLHNFRKLFGRGQQHLSFIKTEA